MAGLFINTGVVLSIGLSSIGTDHKQNLKAEMAISAEFIYSWGVTRNISDCIRVHDNLKKQSKLQNQNGRRLTEDRGHFTFLKAILNCYFKYQILICLNLFSVICLNCSSTSLFILHYIQIVKYKHQRPTNQ